jgi:hypothetical protein
MENYLEIARRVLVGMNLASTPARPLAPQADSPGELKETMPAARAASPAATQREQDPESAEKGQTWAEWKVAALNRLFQEQGTSGQPGQITAATVRHGETRAVKHTPEGPAIAPRAASERGWGIL